MHPSQQTSTPQQKRVQHHASGTDSYAMFNLLTGPQLLDQVEDLLPEHRERLFPPTETLSMFLAQSLSADGSCQQVVNDTAVKRLICGLKPGKTNTGGYCKARARLPLTMISALAIKTGEIVAQGAASRWRWRGRQVRLVDGATVTLPDTKENQEDYPQSNSQKAGLGFPICRLVALLCLGSGALLNGRAAGWPAPWTGRTTCFEAAREAIFIAHRTQASGERWNQEKWAPEKAALNFGTGSLMQRYDL